MARISIEAGVLSDPRFMRLVVACGSAEVAIGSLFFAWNTSQEFWSNGRRLIPLPVFMRLQRAKEILECGFAEIRDTDFVYVNGSSEHHEWLAQRREAGKKGGLKPKENFSSKPKQTPSKTNPLISYSYSYSKKEEQNLNLLPQIVGTAVEKTPAVQPPERRRKRFSDETSSKMKAFIAAYAEGYKAKYGANPEQVRDAAVIGKIGYWIQNLSQERAINLIQVYLQIDYKPFNDSLHDIWKFFQNLNRIGIALETGKEAGAIDWKFVFGRLG